MNKKKIDDIKLTTIKHPRSRSLEAIPDISDDAIETVEIEIKNMPKKIDRKKENYLWKNYGLNYFDWLELIENGCMICGRKEGRLCVDHIHQKGHKAMTPLEKRKYTRGILCFLCNTAIKGFDKTCNGQENRKRLEGTYEYFKVYKLKGEI